MEGSSKSPFVYLSVSLLPPFPCPFCKILESVTYFDSLDGAFKLEDCKLPRYACYFCGREHFFVVIFIIMIFNALHWPQLILWNLGNHTMGQGWAAIENVWERTVIADGMVWCQDNKQKVRFFSPFRKQTYANFILPCLSSILSAFYYEVCVSGLSKHPLLLIHSLANKCILSPYHMPLDVMGTGDVLWTKDRQVLAFM